MTGTEMTGRKRKALLAAVVSLFGMTAAVPMIVSGTASAQSGSRLCGRVYETTPGSDIPKETVILLYEVQKNDRGTACDRAKKKHHQGAFDSPFDLAQKNSRFWNDDGAGIDMEICEDFKTYRLGGRELNFLGDNWPANDQNDICNNMNRSDTIFDMEAYWLHDRDGQGKWDFVRG